MTLEYTRHPLVDAGVAAVAAFCGKSGPGGVGEEEMEDVVEYISKQYPRKPASSFVQLAFTINAVYTQPSKSVEQREADSRAFLSAIIGGGSNSGDERCVFCGRGALAEDVKSMKEVSAPITRQHIPLILAKGLMNFFPAFSSSGVSVCGHCLFALQAMPLGAGSCGGRLLVVHSDDEDTNLHFAARFVERHRKTFHLSDLTKYPAERFPKTILINELLTIDKKRTNDTRASAAGHASITAYHFTNYGTSADMDMYHLPHQTVEFLHIAQSGKYAAVWNEMSRRGWQQIEDARAGVARNFLYEDLFDLPDGIARFVRVYLLRRGFERAFKDDPRREYGLERDLDLVSWDLTNMFLREVVGMDADRREAIKRLGDRLAAYVSENNSKRFFGNFYRSTKYGELRNLLIKASNDEVRRGEDPIVGFDDFITIFEDGEELARIDWRLARDLVLIRMIEVLRDWLAQNKEAIPEDSPETETVES